MPNRSSRPVDAFLQLHNGWLPEATSEVSSRGRVRNPLGSQTVEEVLILAAQLDVFQSLTADQDVIGQVQDVVALVIRQVDFEQMQVPVQVLHQSQALHHQMEGADTAAVDALNARGHFVNNVAGFEHRSRLVFPVLRCQPVLDSLLAVPQNLGVGSVHSKWPLLVWLLL